MELSDNGIEYRTLAENEITANLFRDFIRTQNVTRVWRKRGGTWVVEEDPFVDDWSTEDRGFLAECLRSTVATGGLVCGAFIAGKLAGFASVEAATLGTRGQYLDLSSLHVSQDARRRGIGAELFRIACGHAAAHGAEKLYISSHSAVETQAFYRAMGCVEAEEYNAEHVEREPFDCQLERTLG